ncbi:MAG: hypothetical protein JW787_10030 [Sedimentisphaerales bacterium]|nr:hypothetical protein [Sedimentisphaerales bacterium]
MKKTGKKRSLFMTLMRWLCSLSILAVLLWYIYIYTGKLLCHIALGQIGELTNTKIIAGSIKYQANCSVVISDITVKPVNNPGVSSEIIKAKRLFAVFNKKSLFLFKPRLNVIDVNDFVFSAVYDVNTGLSNLSEIKIKHPGGSFGKAPNIHLDSGELRYVKIINGHEEVALSVPVDAVFEAQEQPARKYNFNIETATMSSGYGQSHLKGSWEPGKVIVTGGIASLSVPKFDMACLIDVLAAEVKYDKTENFSLSLAVKDMRSLRSREPSGLELVMPSFIEKYGFFTALQKFLDTYKPKGLIDIDLDMSGNLGRLAESTIAGYVSCRDIAFTYSKFPYEIEHLVGKIDFTQDGISFNNLSGRHGESVLSFSGLYKNFGPNREYKVDIVSDKLSLEDDLYKALNEKQQKTWSSFSPAGNVSIDLQIVRKPQADRETNLLIGLLDVNASYTNFPYPLKNLTGKIIFSPDEISAQNVFSRDGSIEIKVNGGILDRRKETPEYNFTIDVNNVPLDSTLEAALQENQKKMYRRLQPTGAAEGSIQVFRPEAGEMDYTADLNFKDTSIKMDFLSEHVTEISAHAVISPDMVVIKDFSGKYGDIPVLLSGSIMPDQEQRLSYDIAMDLKKVQLGDKELRNILPGSTQKTIERFDPNGIADLIVNLKKHDPSESPDYSVIVNCLGNSVNCADFPYPVKNITGRMKIDSDKVEMENVSAFLSDNAHDESENARIILNGDIRIADGIIKQTELNFSAANILFDEQFVSLLPQSCHDLYKSLSPTGSIDFDFKNFRSIKDDNGLMTIEFDSAIGLGKCDFILSNQPARLDSIVLLQGKYISGRGFNNCKVIVDKGTLKILGKTMTALKTEINYDPDRQKWSSEYFLADLYGGKTTGNFEFIQKDDVPMEYILQTAFDNVDLGKFVSDTKLTKPEDVAYTSGKMSGSMSLSSRVPQNNSRIGMCRVSIEDMQVGKLSPMAKILQVLNLNEPSDYAFDSMFIDSYIKRNGLVVEKLDMSGKGVAFYGSGSISLLNGVVDLSLIARGRRLATDDPSVLQSLTEGLGQAVIRMDVTGDYRNVKVATRALPVIEGTLQILGTKPIVEN